MAEPLTLHTLLGDYPVTRALKAGEASSPLIRFDFADIPIVHEGFKPMVREHRFDVGELAIVTFLMAKSRGVRLTLLPAVVSGRFQHHCIAYNVERGALTPADLAGKHVGVRAYSQTTGAWVRGILQSDYGVDLTNVTWVCFEDAHVSDYCDPPNVVRAPEGKKLVQMLLDGELDAAVLGNDMPDDPRLKTVIPNAEEAAKEWYGRTRVIPLNHMVAAKEELAQSRPDVIRELYRLFKESKAAAGPPKGIDMRPYGVEANRKALELAIEYADRQGLLARPLTVDELFDDTTRALV